MDIKSFLVSKIYKKKSLFGGRLYTKMTDGLVDF